MRSKNDSELASYDWLMIFCWISLVAFGWMMIYAAGYSDDMVNENVFDLSRNHGKQLLWIGIGTLLAIGTQFIPGKFFEILSPIGYGLVFLLLFGVLFTAPINGATSWISLGSFRLQPSEFAKVSTCLALAAFIGHPNISIEKMRNKLLALGIVLFPMFMIILQGDAGSTLIYIAFMLVLFRAGLNAWIYGLGIVMIALAILALLYDSTAWLTNALILVGVAGLLYSWRIDARTILGYLILVLLTVLGVKDYMVPITVMNILAFLGGVVMLVRIKKTDVVFAITGVVMVASVYTFSVNYIVNNLIGKHRKERIWVWLRPEKCDPLGPRYNVDQSMYAIGSGSVWGKGYLQGERTKLNYVPEQSTDFIFCTVGEEWGMVGSLLVVGLFFTLIMRILFIAERQRTLFGKFYAYGVACILFMHVFINIGMTTGLVPVIGIPLPFISYGGSSFMSFSMLMGILIKLDTSRANAYK